jgi:succinoglycan biosynthesis transport protein ExoP
MNNLEKYLDQVIEQRPAVYEAPPESAPADQQEQTKILPSLLRRWHIIVLVFVGVCALGLPAVWFLVKPYYVVQGAVQVHPVLENIVTGEPDRGEITDYWSYLNTQANWMTSGQVLVRVADDLYRKNLAFFTEPSSNPISRVTRMLGVGRQSREPASMLKAAIADGTIAVAPIPRSEYIGVTMKGVREKEAQDIVNSFLTNFQSIYGMDAQRATNQRLQKLDTEEKNLKERITKSHQSILALAKENNTTVLDSRQEKEMRRQADLWTELIHVEAQRIGLEADIAVLERIGDTNTPPEKMMEQRTAFVNSNAMVAEWTRNVVQARRELIVAEKMLAPESPELARRKEVLTSLEQALQEKRAEVEKEFDEVAADRQQTINRDRLTAAQTRLEQVKAREQSLNEALAQQDETTRKVGTDSVTLQDIQFQMNLDQQLLENIARSKKNLEMEMSQYSRISIAYPAETARVEDKRVKYSAAVAFLALGCGMGLAFLRDKMDKTLVTPADVTRYLGLPVIGTTTSSRLLKPAAFAEQIAGDYQMIRTNLGLLSNGGMPRRLVVSSAGMREGKTTFAVNLATSLAKSGKKVLLIDGDMRKPDIGFVLNIADGSGGLQDVLMGEDPRGFICVLPASGLHVLPANSRHLADTYELLTSPAAAEQMERLTREYDHIIIDSPPALAFPDALVWAKLADAVILVSFAGQTTAPELKEAQERFARIKARVLGAILSNVTVEQSAYRYGYAYRYRARGGQSVRRARKKRLLLSTQGDGAEGGATKA